MNPPPFFMKKYLNKIPHTWFDLIDWILVGGAPLLIVDSIIQMNWRGALAMLAVELLLVTSIFDNDRQRREAEKEREQLRKLLDTADKSK